MKPANTNLVACFDRRAVLGAAAAIVAALATLGIPTASMAVSRTSHWTILAASVPSYFKAGDEGDFYEINAVNDGGAATDGSTFTVTEALPAGVSATAIYGDAEIGQQGHQTVAMHCPTVEHCESTAIVPVGEMVKVKIMLSVGAAVAGELQGSVTISGGGSEPATGSEITKISSEEVPFGGGMVSDVSTESGVAVQAGSHPAGLTTVFALNSATANKTVNCTLISQFTPSCPLLNADAKDLEVTLPSGLVGDPTVVPKCSQVDFQLYGSANCPVATQVGVVQVGFYGGVSAIQESPIYNVEPPPGEPAELGLTIGALFHIPIYFRVASDGNYALKARLTGISEGAPVWFGAMTVWGVPASPIHDAQRQGPGCGSEGCASSAEERPFLTLPTRCSGDELSTQMSGDSWQAPGVLGKLPLMATSIMPAVTGCDALSFQPSVTVTPDSHQAGAPASYSVDVEVPQNKEVDGLATPDVRSVQLTLPEGTVISPSAANGLAACSEAEFELHSGAVGHCSSQTKVGQVSIVSPLLQTPLHGSVFLGAPECAPCTPADARSGRMLPLLIQAEGPAIVIKLKGHTSVDQSSGRLTTTFSENPQLPFSDLTVSLKGGENAPLVNPTACGDAVAVARLTPWSSMTATTATAPPVSIEGCSPPSFVPSLRAGTANAQAGAFSSFSVTLTRPDGQEDLGSVAVETPPGLLGMLSSVPLCGEAQANAGTCPVTSQIGVTSVSLGPGHRPLTITGGRVYLTGPYAGQPFGLSIVMPTEAGPFQLAGNTGGATEVVRASIAVDPLTAAVRIVSDPLPRYLEGIPLDIRSVDVIVDRPEFMFNPTNCDSQAIAATFSSTSGKTSSSSFPFQAVNCATLPFRPKFAVATQAKTSKARGASLHVKVTASSGQANIRAVKVDLPRQLPSRLTTLQKACVAAVFAANPARCPAASVVGAAKALTPVLSQPLSGPAYLVSHGGAAFPDLEIVLQGQGITLVLDGATHIKNGITSSTFKSLPDAPIKTFDLVLPQGPHSVLAANLPSRAHRSMCGQKLLMPTVITGQNGAVSRKNTAVAVSGCRVGPHN